MSEAAELGDDLPVRLADAPALFFPEIETSTPFTVTVLRQERGTLATERSFHQRFAEYRTKLEWFRKDGALKEFLEGGG